jgi:hypothetical protein
LSQKICPAIAVAYGSVIFDGWRPNRFCSEPNEVRMHRLGVLEPLAYAAGGLCTAIAGKAALDDTGSTWPTILVVVGLFFAANGIRRMSR